MYFFSDHLASPVVHWTLPELRHTIESNMRPVDPEVTPMRVLRAYSRNLLDTVFAQLDGGRESKGPRFEPDPIGDRRIRRALSAGRGAVIVSPHIGGWDVGCRSLELRGFDFSVVAQPETDPTVDAFRRRSRYGGADRTIEAGSTMESFFRVRGELERGGLIVMLGDRARPGDAVPVSFFGRSASFPRSPAAISHLTGAPIVPAAFVRAADGLFRGLSSEPLFPEEGRTDPEALQAATQRLALAFEEFVRAYPEQWFNFYPFWEEPR